LTGLLSRPVVIYRRPAVSRRPILINTINRPIPKPHNSIRIGCDIRVMGNDNQGDALLPVQVPQQGHYRFACL
jgi:hypothetical protein